MQTPERLSPLRIAWVSKRIAAFAVACLSSTIFFASSTVTAQTSEARDGANREPQRSAKLS